jgi:hypothetical protein
MINKKPSSNQKIENVLRQNLFIAEVYLPYLYFLKKNIKPDISIYIKKPTDTNIKINLLNGINLLTSKVIKRLTLNTNDIIQYLKKKKILLKKKLLK